METDYSVKILTLKPGLPTETNGTKYTRQNTTNPLFLALRAGRGLARRRISGKFAEKCKI